MFLQFMTEISGLISPCLDVAAAAVLLGVEIQSGVWVLFLSPMTRLSLRPKHLHRGDKLEPLTFNHFHGTIVRIVRSCRGWIQQATEIWHILLVK